MKLFKRNKTFYDKIGDGEAEEKLRISRPFNVTKGIVFKSCDDNDDNNDDAPPPRSGAGAKWRRWVTKLRYLNTVKY